MEVNEAFLGVAQGRFSEAGAAITTQLGDSAAMMPACCEAIKSAGQSVLFFLDAHFEAHCPLLQELKAIAEAGIKPVIVIHDFQVPGRPVLASTLGRVSRSGSHGYARRFNAIYGANGYGHFFNHEATGARRGVIYIHPLP